MLEAKSQPAPWLPVLPAVVRGTGRNPQQQLLKQHSWRAASDKMRRVQELHGHSELQEWKTCVDTA